MTEATVWGPGATPGPPGPPGPAGEDGASPEFRVNSGWVQWRLAGDSTWINLLQVSTLVGPQGPAGPAGPRGIQGSQGVQGLQGIQGIAGLDGTRWLDTDDIPEEPDGNVGDFALNSVTGDIYYKEEDPEGWVLYMNIIGPQGPVGPAGPASVPQLRSGNGAPSGSSGIVGDFYIDLDSYDIYGPKTTSGWGAPVSMVQPVTCHYGQLWITGNSTPLAVTIATDLTLSDPADYTQLTGIFDATPHGVNHGITQSAASLTVNRAGVYAVAFWGEVASSENATTIGVKFAVNGSLVAARRPRARIGSGGDFRNFSAYSFVQLDAGDVVTFWHAANKTADILWEDAVFSLQELRTAV